MQSECILLYVHHCVQLEAPLDLPPPISESPPSIGASPWAAQGLVYRVFKLWSPDLPCNYSSSLPRLTLGDWESPRDTLLIKPGLFDSAWSCLLYQWRNLLAGSQKYLAHWTQPMHFVEYVFYVHLCICSCVLWCENGVQKATSKSCSLLSWRTWGPSYDLQTW